MTNKGSIGNLAEQILNEVKTENLTKVAQAKFVKTAEKLPNPKTAIGKLLHKIASDLRTAPSDDGVVTVGDVKDFLNGVGHAG